MTNLTDGKSVIGWACVADAGIVTGLNYQFEVYQYEKDAHMACEHGQRVVQVIIGIKGRP